MKHATEEELIAYCQRMSAERGELAEHLAGCDECRKELERIEAVLAALDTLPVPDPGEDYGRRVWQQLAPRLPEKRVRWWHSWFEAKRLTALGAVAAMVILAFWMGRRTGHPGGPDLSASKEQVRERVLVVAVGEHLGRSEMMLVELSNAELTNPGQKRVSIASEQRRAEDLLDENRLYRQTALEEGDTALASVLDELERVLLDVAHSPDQLTPAQLEKIRQKIEARGILFKVRVVSKELQERQSAPKPPQDNSVKQERNKA